MIEQTVSPKQAFWISEIETYERKFQDWEKRSKDIIDRYKDERKGTNSTKARFNVLWSNVQTLQPALYASPPKVNVDRRFQDDDDLGRISALVLERSASYYVNHDIFNEVMKQCVQDRLLGGRGTSWVRYVPVFEDKVQVSDDKEVEQDLYSEDAIPDYVHWQDFGHTFARTWQEVRGVWRIVYMSRAELVKRFGEELGNQIPLDAKKQGKEEDSVGYKATIYEIWDKTSKKAYWLHKSMKSLLDEREDPLKLKDFFPCPKPIYATLTNDCLVPVPDYVLYQDQAQELDMLTGRIASITKALKVAGVYDAGAQGVDRLLAEGVENKLIPVDQYAAYAEKGGLAGVFTLLPMGEIMQVLIGLYDARDRVKNDLYEITGISDVIRGATKANETATAQQLKGQYAGLRLDSQQQDVARFARDIVRIMTEIIAEHFSIETIKQVSGVKLLTTMEKEALRISAQMGQPIDEEKQELLDLPTWEEVEALIRNDMARCFRVDIETDSTIKADQEAEKAARVEFLTASAQFIQQMQTVQNPEILPLLMEMLMFGVRGFKVARELETAFDTTIDKMKKQLEAPPAPPPPSPEQISAQAEQQRQQHDIVVQQQKTQADMQAKQMDNDYKLRLEQVKAQGELEKSQVEASVKSRELAIKEQEMRLKEKELEMKFVVERMNIELEKLRTVSAGEAQETPDNSADIMEALNQGLQALMNIQMQGNQAVVQAIQNPPARQVIRDNLGNVVGVQ